MQWSWVVTALLLSAVLILSLTPPVGLFHDDGIYVSVAGALAEGRGHYLVNLPTEPSQTKYPPFYTSLLAGVWLLHPTFPDNVFLLKGLNLVFLFVALIGIAMVAHRRLSPGRPGAVPVLCQLLLATSPGVVTFLDFTMSDILFMTLVIWVIALWDDTRPRGRQWFTLVLGSCAILTRVLGVAITFALVAESLLGRRWLRAAVHGIVGVSVASAWLAWASWSRGAASHPLIAYYVEYEEPAAIHLLSDPSRAWMIVEGNIRMLWSQLSFVSGPGWDLLWPLLAALAGVGSWSLLRGGWRLPFLFAAAYCALVVLHPFSPHRYVLPLLPILVLSVVEGLLRLGSFLESRRHLGQIPRAVPLIVLTAILLLGNALWAAAALRAPHSQVRGWYGTTFSYEWSGFDETFTWIRSHTPPDSTIGSIYDPMYFLYTGRRGVRPWFHQPETYFYPLGSAEPHVGHPEEVLAELRSLGVEYVVIDPSDGYSEGTTAAALLRNLVRLPEAGGELLFTSADGRHEVWRLRPDHYGPIN